MQTSILPDLTLQILDGSLGQVAPSSARASLAIGACSRGVANQFYSHSNMNQLFADLGSGPLPEARAQVLGIAGGPAYSVPTVVSTFGALVGSVVHTGPGAGSVAVSFAPDRRIDAKIMAGGALGTMTVSFSVGGGAYSAPILSSASAPWTVQVPGTLCKLSFVAATYTANDVYTVDTLGAVTVTGTGPSTNVTQASSPLDKYDGLVTIGLGGALGTATFTHATDNNVIAGSQQIPTQSGVVQVPTAGKFAIPGTGIMLTFSGSFIAGDTYAFSTSAPSVINSDYVTALQAAFAVPIQWFCVHVVGTAANAAGAASLAGAIDAQMTIAEAAYRYAFAVVQAPQDADIAGSTNTDAALQTAFVNWTSLRVCVAAGDCRLRSALNGRVMRRNAAYPIVARLASIAPSIQAHDVGQDSGVYVPLKNVLGLYRDEGVTTFLDPLGFSTLRSYVGVNVGYFVTRALIFTPPGSDYQRVSNRRVMDLISASVRRKAIAYVGRRIATDKQGLIRESTAQAIEGDIESAVRLDLQSEITDVKVTVTRDNNILSTSQLIFDVGAQPYSYSDYIGGRLGFYNPALAA
jgi:hypothetical protein